MESLEENAIPKIKQIVAKKQAMKIDGVMVDMFTASAISQIYDKVNDANKKKMEKMKVTQLANAAMKLMRRNSVSEATLFKKGKLEVKFERGEVVIAMKGNSPSAIADRVFMSKAEFTALQKALPKMRLKEEFNIEIAEGLEEGKKENKKAQIEKIKLMRKVKATTRGQKIALGDLLAMTSPKVLEGMFKQNPRGFMTMLQKMNPKRDKLTKADYIVDGQFVTSLGNLLTKDQTKELKENNKDKAFRDFRRAGGGRKRGVDPADQDMKATDDDRKAASKNIIMQLRRVSDLPRGGKVEFENGKTINVTKKDAVKIGQFFDRLRKPQDKAKFQAMIYKSPADMKKVLSKLR